MYCFQYTFRSELVANNQIHCQSAWRGRTLWGLDISLIMVSGEKHAVKRKPWNRAFSTPALKGYEDIISRRAEQLVRLIASHSTIDLGVCLSWFTYVSSAMYSYHGLNH